MKISGISIDMFETLVTVDKRIEEVWKAILEDEYRKESVPKYINKYHEFFGMMMETAYGSKDFIKLKTIFKCVFSKIKYTNNYNFDVEKAVEVLIEEHSKACFFIDTTAFFNQWNHECELWLSSDADHVMIDPLLSELKFDRKFISEDIKAYKRDNQDRFFRRIISETNVNAKEIIHVGDSLSDIIGAKRAGIKACWLNRLNIDWNNQCRPDYTISSLIELPDLLKKINEMDEKC